MAEYEMFKTTLMGGYDKEEVQEQIQRLRDEMAEQEELYKKQIGEKDARIAELQKRIELKEEYQARLEEDIKEKYQKYIDNYESIGKLVFEAQVRADTMEKETREKCEKLLQDAEAEAKRKVESVQSEIDDKLMEGKKKYLAVQEEMNGIVELINQAQKRFMSSYKEVHHIISSMPTSLNDLEEEVELELSEMKKGEDEKAAIWEIPRSWISWMPWRILQSWKNSMKKTKRRMRTADLLSKFPSFSAKRMKLCWKRNWKIYKIC